MVVTPQTHRRRNPGPAWGFRFLLWADRYFPAPLFRVALYLGSAVAVVLMKDQRGHSRDFWRILHGKNPSVAETIAHFYAFAKFLLVKLRVARGASHRCRLSPVNGPEFTELVNSPQPALFGTFHFGDSDLLGFFLGDSGRRVSMIRLQVENSDDTRLLGLQFGKAVSFIWVNEPANLLFAIKRAIEAGESLAMKCDRLAYSARVEPFEFLGKTRLFPFTIYYLSLLFNRPVIFCLGLPEGLDDTLVLASPVFVPDNAPHLENLARARRHFQSVLRQLETLVRQHPTLWFNFIELNSEVPTASPTPRKAAAPQVAASIPPSR